MRSGGRRKFGRIYRRFWFSRRSQSTAFAIRKIGPDLALHGPGLEFSAVRMKEYDA
jgi:hypothetical protein